jgi:hypothetical protein
MSSIAKSVPVLAAFLALSPALLAGEADPKDFATPVVDLRPLPKKDMLEVQTGVLWKVSSESPADVTILATHLVYEPDPHFVIPFGPGSISLGPSWKLLADIYLEGPESYYLGLAGGPVIEYWLGDETAFFFRPQGGFGITDAAGEEGDGQGQDFTLNYEFEFGVRHEIAKDVTISVSAYYQHFSNWGMTDYNVGYNNVGPMIGLSWSF